MDRGSDDTPPPGTLIDTGAPAPAPAATVRRGVRYPVLAALLAVALLAIGAAGAMLFVGPPRDGAVPAADSVDVGFLQDMSMHHEQAVTMASWARDHTTDPAVAQLSTDMELTQTGQLGRMQGWLEMWGAAAFPLGNEHMAWMGDATHAHGGGTDGGPVSRMPGMATTEELAEQRASVGPAGDTLFLQLMLRHHEGGLAMLAYGAQHAQTHQVRNLAAQMLSSQEAESAVMRAMLAERGAPELEL